MANRRIESWEQLVENEVAMMDALEEPEEDFGLEYEAWEELAFGIKELERDRHRWELDPASAEDYPDRYRVLRTGPSLRWRHFGH